MRFIPRLVTPAMALAAVAALSSCGDEVSPAGTTALSIKLTDAPADIRHAFVTITQVELLGESGRQVLRDEPFTADLLTLAGRTADLVTDAEVLVGTYHELRFLISGACIAAENESGGTDIYATDGYDPEPCGGEAAGTLVSPGFAQSGLKVVFASDALVLTDAEEVLVVDFDVAQSFGRAAGESGRWVMHPVVTGAQVEASQ